MKYKVLLTREASMSAWVEVEAESENDARDEAVSLARDGGVRFELNDDDCCGDVWVTDVEEDDVV